MSDFNAFVSPEYPVLHTVLRRDQAEATLPPGHAGVSLALLVKGIPSFLATIPVRDEELDDITRSLESGAVRVAVVGVSVDGNELPDGVLEEDAPWAPSDDGRTLPAAYLSLVCGDGRRIGVARIVARQESASPEDVARFVLKQIAKGVQIPDLASAS
jgi:hypothetical protein